VKIKAENTEGILYKLLAELCTKINTQDCIDLYKKIINGNE
jgi:hypothetical protein